MGPQPNQEVGLAVLHPLTFRRCCNRKISILSHNCQQNSWVWSWQKLTQMFLKLSLTKLLLLLFLFHLQKRSSIVRARSNLVSKMPNKKSTGTSIFLSAGMKPAFDVMTSYFHGNSGPLGYLAPTSLLAAIFVCCLFPASLQCSSVGS